MFDLSEITWRRPWWAVTPKEAKDFEEELQHEVCKEHVLFNRKVKAIGHRVDCDDVLFHLEDAGTQMAVSHLTWKKESHYNWPSTEFFTSAEDWIKTRMMPDVKITKTVAMPGTEGQDGSAQLALAIAVDATDRKPIFVPVVGHNSRDVWRICMRHFLPLILLAFVFLQAQEPSLIWVEKPLAPGVNAYNPVPNPDRNMIAFVRLAWGREGGSGGYGSSNLTTDIMVMDSSGRVLKEQPLANAYLMGWTADGMKLICFRDWEYFLVDLDGRKFEAMPQATDDNMTKSIHCGFLSKSNQFVWITSIVAESKHEPDGLVRTTFSGCDVRTKSGVLVHTENMLDFAIPSPDEKWLATFRNVGMYATKKMWVYDTVSKSWTTFGEITPQPCWGWADAWTPWFPDSSKLVIAHEDEILVCTANGKDKKSIAKMEVHTGLPVVSPDGMRIAFVTWRGTAQPNPGTTIWIVPVDGDKKPKIVVPRFTEDTMGLKWLSNDELVFDRYVRGERRQAPTPKLYTVKEPKNKD